jgi:5'-deoxynucleotidase YfbR-like HD superfamily hydrolase
MECMIDMQWAEESPSRSCGICGLGPCQRGYVKVAANQPAKSSAAIGMASPEPTPRVDISDAYFSPMLRNMRRIRRWGSVPLSEADDVAGHSYYVAVYAWMLAKLIGWVGDMHALLIEALLHDVEEIFTGEMIDPVKRAVADPDKWNHFARTMIEQRMARYRHVSGTSGVKAIVRAADKLDCVYFIQGEALRGNAIAAQYVEPCIKDAQTAFDTACRQLGMPSILIGQHWANIRIEIEYHNNPRNYRL